MKRILVLLLTAGFAACGGSSDTAAPSATDSSGSAARPQIAFVTNNMSDFWTIAQAGTKKAAEEFHCDVLFRVPAAGTAQEQQQIVQDLLVKRVAGIAISPKDPANQTELLNQAAAATKLITQDSDAPDSNRICYIGTNNYEAGVAAGELVKKAIPNGGHIMLFVGTLDAQNAQDRKRGIEDAIQGTNIRILDTRTDEVDQAKAKANAQDALVKHADLAAMVGLWAYNGPAILAAVESAGKLGQVQIVAFDEQEETLQGVADGHIAGTIVQQPFEFGYQSVKLLVELHQGDETNVPENKQIFIPVITVTKDNVAEFWAQLRELLGKA